MNCKPPFKWRLLIGVSLLIAMCFGVWWWLGRLGPQANWLEVEAPPQAVIGQDLPIRVRIAPASEAAFVSADLHWHTTRDTTEGFLAFGGSRSLLTGGTSCEFRIPVPQRE